MNNYINIGNKPINPSGRFYPRGYTSVTPSNAGSSSNAAVQVVSAENTVNRNSGTGIPAATDGKATIAVMPKPSRDLSDDKTQVIVSPAGAVNKSAPSPGAANKSATSAGSGAENGTAAPIGFTLDLTNKSMLDGIVLSEILGKPKFLRRGRW